MFLGSMKVMYDKGMLNDVEEISCSSCGSLIGLFYILEKGNVDEVCRIAFEQDITDVASPNLKTLVKSYGILNPKKLVSKIIKSTGGLDLTFRELYEMNPIKLYIATFDLVTNKTIYMSIDTTPDMKITTAIVRSVSIPFVFCPEIERDLSHIYLDGSVCDPTPYVPFIGKKDVFEIRYANRPSTSVPRNLFQFIRLVIVALLHNRYDYTDFPRITIIPLDNLDVYDFKMNTDKKMILFKEGYEQAMSKLSV